MKNLGLQTIKKITVFTIFLFFVVFPTTVFSANKCSTLGDKLKKIYDKRETKLTKHRDMLSKIRGKWESVLNAYKSSGCDVTNLGKHINELVQLVRDWGNSWEKEYDLYVYSLQTARTYACSNKKNAFRSTMKNARKHHKAMLEAEKTYSKKIEQQINWFISKDVANIQCPKP